MTGALVDMLIIIIIIIEKDLGTLSCAFLKLSNPVTDSFSKTGYRTKYGSWSGSVTM